MNKDLDEHSETSPLLRPLRVIDIDEAVEHKVEATSDEIAEMVRLLGLVSLDGLKFEYRLRRGVDGRVNLLGKLQAHVAQTCVVSLEPIETDIDIPVEVEFWPQPMLKEIQNEPEEPGETGRLDWPELITDGTIDIGPVIYETLGTALDLYPKRADAKLEWSQAAEDAEALKVGPFAALKQLKKP
jgi:uncharacterized metal-binding protein YceD (DUF177 family)